MPVVLKLERVSELPGRLVKIQVSGRSHRVSDSVGLRWGPGICTPSKFPGAVAAAVILLANCLT